MRMGLYLQYISFLFFLLIFLILLISILERKKPVTAGKQNIPQQSEHCRRTGMIMVTTAFPQWVSALVMSETRTRETPLKDWLGYWSKLSFYHLLSVLVFTNHNSGRLRLGLSAWDIQENAIFLSLTNIEICLQFSLIFWENLCRYWKNTNQ